MNIDELTIGEAKELVEMFGSPTKGMSASDDSHWKVGKNYMIRTVTHINIGTLIGVTDKELILKDASWIADTGRFEQAVKEGLQDEIEPFPDGEIVIMGRGALIDAVVWRHELPRQQK